MNGITTHQVVHAYMRHGVEPELRVREHMWELASNTFETHDESLPQGINAISSRVDFSLHQGPPHAGSGAHACSRYSHSVHDYTKLMTQGPEWGHGLSLSDALQDMHVWFRRARMGEGRWSSDATRGGASPERRVHHTNDSLCCTMVFALGWNYLGSFQWAMEGKLVFTPKLLVPVGHA
jgi:hypothetical protein